MAKLQMLTKGYDPAESTEEVGLSPMWIDTDMDELLEGYFDGAQEKASIEDFAQFLGFLFEEGLLKTVEEDDKDEHC